MTTDKIPRRFLPLLGGLVVLACGLAGIWLATAVILPSSQILMQKQGTEVPAYLRFAFNIQSPCLHAVYPLAMVGVILFSVALFRRAPTGFGPACRTALPWLAGFIACGSIYLLGSASLAYRLAGGDRLAEMAVYKGTLERFALLEMAQGRIETLREMQGLKMVVVGSVSEFSNEEVSRRISTLLRALPTAKDQATKRSILATLSLFRERIPKKLPTARDVPRHAMEAGAPVMQSPDEALDWIAANLNKDGWEPLPLYKFVR